MLTQELVRELFDYNSETGGLIWRTGHKYQSNIGKVAGGKTKKGYYSVEIEGKNYFTHRLVYLWHHGYIPTFIDHINRIKTDNRIENLRPASAAQNSANSSKRSNTSSKWKGVSYQASKGWWRAYISFENKPKYLGRFHCEFDAALTFNFYAKNLHGEFAVYNEAIQTCPIVT